MERTEVDGVATFWEQGPPPLTAALVFGVGTRHETFRTAQVAHMVEHLVMSTLPKSHLDCNARVGADSTVFHATGPADLVSDFLERVCDALRSLPMDGLSREAGVLEAEEAMSAHPALCWAAGMRFGNRGPGLLAVEGPGASQLTDEHVTRFVEANYVRENAALILSGPPPAGLQLDLPAGHDPTHTQAEVEETSLGLPALISDATPHPTMSMVLPNARAASALARILVDRVSDDVRHARGVAYDVDFDAIRVDADRALVAIYTDGKVEHTDAITGSMWAALHALAVEGPTNEELAHDLAGFEAYLDDPRSIMDWLEDQALRHLRADPVLDRQQARAELADIDAATIREWAGFALRTALVGTPQPLKTPLAGLADRTGDERPSARPVEGERFPRKLVALAPRDLRVDVADTGLSQTAGGYTVSASWDRVVGVACAPGLRLLLLADGGEMLLWAKHLRDAPRLFDIVRARVPEVHFTSTEDTILSQV